MSEKNFFYKIIYYLYNKKWDHENTILYLKKIKLHTNINS